MEIDRLLDAIVDDLQFYIKIGQEPYKIDLSPDAYYALEKHAHNLPVVKSTGYVVTLFGVPFAMKRYQATPFEIYAKEVEPG